MKSVLAQPQDHVRASQLAPHMYLPIGILHIPDHGPQTGQGYRMCFRILPSKLTSYIARPPPPLQPFAACTYRYNVKSTIAELLINQSPQHKHEGQHIFESHLHHHIIRATKPTTTPLYPQITTSLPATPKNTHHSQNDKPRHRRNRRRQIRNLHPRQHSRRPLPHSRRRDRRRNPWDR